ncbi:MAG: ABC transporter substrate-binding protein, partial [Gemmatimonadaceae bacterium]
AAGALAVMAFALAASCAPANPSNVGAEQGDSLYIGVAAAVTTATSPYFDGVSLAVDRLNAERPSGSRPFAIRRPPSEQSTQVAVAASFRDDPSVIGVVGHTGSAQTLEAAPVYGDVEGGGRRAVVAISPTATNPRATRTSEWVFRVCPTDADGATRLAHFASDSLGSRHVAVLYRNDLFGRGFVRVFAEALGAGSSGDTAGAVVIDRYPYLAGITEYEAYAADIAARGASVVVIAGGGEDATNIVRAIRRAGAAPAFLGTDDVAGLGTGPDAGEFRGLRYITFFLAGEASAGAPANFVDDYRRRYGRLPDHRAALSYDAATLIGRAALAVGSNRRRIRDWVANVGRDAAPFEGITGQVRFDEWGDPSGKPVLLGEVRP